MHLYIKKVLKKAKYCQFQYFKISVVMQKWLLCFCLTVLVHAMSKVTNHLRNEFYFSGVHGAMNRSGSRAK